VQTARFGTNAFGVIISQEGFHAGAPAETVANDTQSSCRIAA
jgi:hypothetical protein